MDIFFLLLLSYNEKIFQVAPACFDQDEILIFQTLPVPRKLLSFNLRFYILNKLDSSRKLTSTTTGLSDRYLPQNNTKIKK